uniref:CutA divalent cation tolerance homolog n=1 Tax=Acanthochromis polyacanthus TaxID=80966 RepID=A0A3Q1F0L8_9TELE
MINDIFCPVCCPRAAIIWLSPATACVIILLIVFMFQVLRTVGLRAFSMASETYTSGTHCAAFVTCPNDTVAKDLARWFIQQDATADNSASLATVSNHPYEVAEVISLPIDQGNPPYLKWIGDIVPE